MEYDNLPIAGRINMAVIIEPIIKNIRDTKVKIFLDISLFLFVNFRKLLAEYSKTRQSLHN